MRNTLFNQITLVTAFLGLSSAFLLVDNCPVSSPCTCSGSSGSYSYIYCYSKSLTNIPYIKQSSSNVNKLYLYFYSNRITVIQNNAFRNLSSINASEIDLRLYNNKIHSIESNAFNGIANTTTSLDLHNNNLTILPSAIKNLFNLRTLNVLQNPLYSLDTSSMSNIGGSLTSFSLDLKLFTEWPGELHYLRVLQTLTVNYIPFPHLDINAFHGFKNTLTSLTLDFSKLEKVPYAVCHLSHLSSLTFRYDNNLQENRSSILEPCGKKLSSLTSLYLYLNNLHMFPDVFTLFPSITSLALYGNKLQYIDITKIPFHSKLTSIDLQRNLLERIPYALNRFKSLKSLYLFNNKILTIETPDLAGLSSLLTLTLTGNPITYIEPNAFKHNVYLNYLDLDGTHLDHVPVAVTNLTKLSSFYLSGREIDCSCDMSYLKSWNVSSITPFSKKCASSSETVKHFIMTSLQTCP